MLTDGAFEVENPFLWLTKGEVVDVIGDNGCAELIKHSVSCTHTREMTRMFTHCGKCSQCISRRFATLASKYADHDPWKMYKVDLLAGDREKDNQKVRGVRQRGASRRSLICQPEPFMATLLASQGHTLRRIAMTLNKSDTAPVAEPTGGSNR